MLVFIYMAAELIRINLHTQPDSGWPVASPALCERVERRKGISAVPLEDVPQLMLEGVIGRLGIFSFADLCRDGGEFTQSGLTYPGG